jgi:GGDEF domain-containing protein
MCPEEMQRELLTSEVTGLPNRRAFNEAGAAGAVAMSDVDGLKALNEYGYEVGNAVLKAKANALREVGLDGYHDKGDEFLCRGHSIKALVAKLDGIAQYSRKGLMEVV